MCCSPGQPHPWPHLRQEVQHAPELVLGRPRDDERLGLRGLVRHLLPPLARPAGPPPLLLPQRQLQLVGLVRHIAAVGRGAQHAAAALRVRQLAQSVDDLEEARPQRAVGLPAALRHVAQRPEDADAAVARPGRPLAATHNGVDDLVRRHAGEGALLGQHLPQHDTKGVHLSV